MTFGPIWCPDNCCAGGGPFDFYGMGTNNCDQPTSENGKVDMLYLTDSVRELGTSNPYTSVDEDWFCDYDTSPVEHAAEHKADILYTIAPWMTSGERCWVVRDDNEWHPDTTQGDEEFAGAGKSTDDLDDWTAGADAAIDAAEDLLYVTTDASTATAYIEESFTGLENPGTYEFRLVAQPLQCTKLLVTITGVIGSPVTHTLNLSAITGGDEITQVDADVYEWLMRETTTGTTMTIQIRMISNATTYDGTSGDGVIIEWTSMRESGTTLYDVALCDVVAGMAASKTSSIINHYLPTNVDQVAWQYTYPATALASVPPGTTESQTTYPDSSGFNAYELFIAGLTMPQRKCTNDQSDYEWWDNLPDQAFFANSTQAGFLDCNATTSGSSSTGVDVLLTMSGGSYSTLIGGPCWIVTLEEPRHNREDLTYLATSTRLDDGEPSPTYLAYYKEPASLVNSVDLVPRIIHVPPHSYPKAFGYLPARPEYWDCGTQNPTDTTDAAEEAAWGVVEVKETTDTCYILFDDIVERNFNFKRVRPNAPSVPSGWHPNAQVGTTAETRLTMADGASVLWYKSITYDRVISFGHIFMNWGTYQWGIAAHRETGVHTTCIECQLLWGDADTAGNAKAIVSWRTHNIDISDSDPVPPGPYYYPFNGTTGYITPWENWVDPVVRRPFENFVDYTYAVEVTGESGSEKSATSWADAASKYTGLCSLGVGKFVYFEDLGSDRWKMHVTGAGAWTLETETPETGTHDGGDASAILIDSGASWTIDEWIGVRIYNTTKGTSGIATDNDATSITVTIGGAGTWDDDDVYRLGPAIVADVPDCVAASERHFYVEGWWMRDNRMANDYSKNWCFGHAETDNAWPLREIVTGDRDDDESVLVGNYIASSLKGNTEHDSIKNSSVLDLVPEQNRHADRVWP